MTILEEILEAWRYTRQGVIEEVENLPAERVTERPQGLLRSPLELAHHIVRSGRLMAGELSRADGNFRRRPYEELLAEHSDADPFPGDRSEAIELLRRSHAEGDAVLRGAGEIRMLQLIRQFDGSSATRLSWLHHGISHEEYHRGQLVLYARLLGETPALTKRIQAG